MGSSYMWIEEMAHGTFMQLSVQGVQFNWFIIAEGWDVMWDAIFDLPSHIAKLVSREPPAPRTLTWSNCFNQQNWWWIQYVNGMDPWDWTAWAIDVNSWSYWANSKSVHFWYSWQKAQLDRNVAPCLWYYPQCAFLSLVDLHKALGWTISASFKSSLSFPLISE